MPSISFLVGAAPGGLADRAVGDAAQRLAADLGADLEGRRQEIERLVGPLHHVERARQAERAEQLDAIAVGEGARALDVDLLGPQQRDLEQADAELLEPVDLRLDAAEIPDRGNGESVQSKYIHRFSLVVRAQRRRRIAAADDAADDFVHVGPGGDEIGIGAPWRSTTMRSVTEARRSAGG